MATPSWESQSATDCWLVASLQLTTGEKMVGLSLNPEIAARVLGDVEAEFGKFSTGIVGSTWCRQSDRAARVCLTHKCSFHPPAVHFSLFHSV